MNINEEEEIKKEFQLERVILFTDAVFAIILTIMVLDLKLPDGIRGFDDAGIKKVSNELILKFVGYLVTFALVARFWMVHLKLFRYLKDYDATLLVLNLIFLFCVSLFPFAVPLITGSIHIEQSNQSWGLSIYVCIVYSVVFMQALVASYLRSNKGILVIDSPKLDENLQWKIQRINLFMIPFMVIIVAVLNYYHVYYLYTLYTIVGYGAITGRLTSKFYPDTNKGPIIMRLYRALKEARAKRKTKRAHAKKVKPVEE